MEMGNRKDLGCSCGLINRLCDVFIRFGVAVTRFRNAFHGDSHHNNSIVLLASDKQPAKLCIHTDSYTENAPNPNPQHTQYAHTFITTFCM